MTGKAFKQWAATIHDEAEIQTKGLGYGREWETLDPRSIRAYTVTSPVAEQIKTEDDEPVQPAPRR